MENSQLVKAFERMGARLKLETPRWNRGNFVLNIQNDKKGEYFSVYIDPEFEKNAEVIAVDVQPKDRHMLLMVKYPDDRQGMFNKDKFLCGHDERHWFVAPVSPAASTVASAKAALRPAVVQRELEQKQVKSKKRDKRHNEAYIRQGEWFFIPRPNAVVDPKFVLKNEPIRRGRGKPHLCQFLTRQGGDGVYVCPLYPNGLTEREYKKVLSQNPRLKNQGWTRMVRNARVMVKGSVTHPDHKTISLPCWHEVLVNTERQSLGLGAVRSAFLD